MKTSNTTLIDVGQVDTGRPRERAPKSNLKTDLLKKSALALQYVSPKTVSGLVWKEFTRPGRSQYTKPQEVLIGRASIGTLSYQGHDLVTYRWGQHGPRVLLAHGWNSKIADFRMLIDRLVDYGYVVEGVDWKAHGQSTGTHTALPEMRDVLKAYYTLHGPFDAVIGYSIGGLAAGMTLSEMSKELLPRQLFLFAAPPYMRYFFSDTIEDLGFNQKVYRGMCELVEKHYHESIDYFDLRNKTDHFDQTELHLLYDEKDNIVPFERSADMLRTFPHANFVHTKGLGHYKIIAHDETVAYVTRALENRRELAAASVG